MVVIHFPQSNSLSKSCFHATQVFSKHAAFSSPFCPFLKFSGILRGLFCSRQGFILAQCALEFTIHHWLASDLQQTYLSLRSSGIIGLSRQWLRISGFERASTCVFYTSVAQVSVWEHTSNKYHLLFKCLQWHILWASFILQENAW